MEKMSPRTGTINANTSPRIAIVLDSRAGAGAGVYAGVGACCGAGWFVLLSDAPQMGQKLAFSGTTLPHFVQNIELPPEMKMVLL